jgi:hypothetical protein
VRRLFSQMDQYAEASRPEGEIHQSLLVLPVVFLLLSTCNSILPPSIVRKLIICLGSSRSSSGTCSR